MPRDDKWSLRYDARPLLYFLWQVRGTIYKTVDGEEKAHEELEMISTRAPGWHSG